VTFNDLRATFVRTVECFQLSLLGILASVVVEYFLELPPGCFSVKFRRPCDCPENIPVNSNASCFTCFSSGSSSTENAEFCPTLPLVYFIALT
jgi:hypothetical protein